MFECHKLENLPFGIQETSKVGGIGLMQLFQVGVFTWLNCGLIRIQNNSIVQVPQIGKSSNGVKETSNFGGIGLI